MQIRQLVAVIAAAFSLTVTTAGLAQASYDSAPITTHAASSTGSAEVAVRSCYQQVEQDSGSAVWSEKFTEPEFAAYTARGADDFTLSRSCLVRSIDVVGTYGAGAGPADSENIVLYSDDASRPGSVITRQTVVGTDASGNGSFHLELKQPLTLRPGTYWVSVRANISYVVAGNWGWEVTSELHATGAMWKNPGDGFATGCTTYVDLTTCLGGSSPGPDFMFAVNRSR